MISNIAYASLNTYFSMLGDYGRVSDCDTKRVLMLIAIEYLMNSDYAYYITDTDYRSISRTLYNLYGSTFIIDYPQFVKSLPVDPNLGNRVLRKTESSILRSTVNRDLRNMI